MTETTDPLHAEHLALRRSARAQRKAFQASSKSTFVVAMKSAMTEYLEMRKKGVSREDAVNGLELVLRESWPQTPSKFGPACDACDDCGWEIKTCHAHARCGRQRCAMDPSHEHTYAVPCQCEKGQRRQRQLLAVDDQLAAVGRTKKRHDFELVGR
jgi:hypothetical protein